MITSLDCAGKVLRLDSPQVMGVLNVTPDSFSDGGRYCTPAQALEQAQHMVEQGAAIIDIGGESTRPGAAAVSVAQELDRVLPVIEALAQRVPVPISIDTSKPQVMREAVRAGAGMINDVRALREPGALEAAVQARVPVCLMHMQGQPRSMQEAPHYADVVAEVSDFLRQRMAACMAAGMRGEHLLIDPGFGFGKSLRHNLDLLAHLDTFQTLGVPVLAGLSRKSLIGRILGGAPVQERLHASVGAAVICALKGARILRVHDVAQTCQALAVVTAMNQRESLTD